MIKYRAVVHVNLFSSVPENATTFKSMAVSTPKQAEQIGEAMMKRGACGYSLEAYVPGPGWVVWDEGDQDPADMARNYAQKNDD
jgi:hypothetical protein